MNSRQSRRAKVKKSGVLTSFNYHSELTTSVSVPLLLTWFDVIGYTVVLQSDIISGRYQTERSSNTEVVLRDRLSSTLQRINPKISPEVIAQAIYQIYGIKSLELLENNRRLHQLLTAGVDVTSLVNHQLIHERVSLIDTVNLLNNDWLVIHPLTVKEESYTQSLDVVVFINGLPLAVIIWNSTDETATLQAVYQRFQTYLQKIPQLFFYNAFVVIVCNHCARVGTLTSQWPEFLPWRTIDGEDFTLPGETQLEVLIQGLFDKRRFLELVKHFLVFEENGDRLNKKLLRYPFCTVPNPKKHKMTGGNYIF